VLTLLILPALHKWFAPNGSGDLLERRSVSTP